MAKLYVDALHLLVPKVTELELPIWVSDNPLHFVIPKVAKFEIAV